jgi:hypothetical protein
MTRQLLLGLTAAWTLSGLAAAQTPEVIFCEIDTSPKSDVPGASVATKWKALEDFNVSHDGAFFALKGRTQNGTDDTFLLFGNRALTTLAAIGEESQTIPGNAPLQFDFFDTGDPVSFDLAGNMALSFRSKGGATNTHEKIMWLDPGLTTYDIVMSQMDPLVGCSDSGTPGDETLGNSVGSVSGLQNGEIFFGVTPINNCSSFFYPGLFITDVANTQANKFLQSRADSIAHMGLNGTDPIDGFTQGDGTMTPDGLHWVMEAEVENEAAGSDRIFIVDGVVVLQELFSSGVLTSTMDDIFQTRMVSNGDYITRGDDINADDFAYMNGAYVLETGSSIPFSGPQVGVVDDTISGVACNRLGDWVATCGLILDVPDTATDEVLLFNGEIVAREGDPVDVDGNGLFDDGAFIGRGNLTSAAFAANDLYLTDDLYVYVILQLHDGAGNDLNSNPSFGTPDAFARIRLEYPNGNNVKYCFGNAAECPCGNGGSGLGGCDNAQSSGGVVATLTGFNPNGLGGGQGTITGTGYPTTSEPTAIVIRSPFPATPPATFGDGLRCISTQSLVRLAAAPAITGTSVHTFSHGAGAGSFFYQLWYRNTPSTFCDAFAAFNLSNGQRVTW